MTQVTPNGDRCLGRRATFAHRGSCEATSSDMPIGTRSHKRIRVQQRGLGYFRNVMDYVEPVWLRVQMGIGRNLHELASTPIPSD